MISTNELKVAESQKVFYFGSNLPKNVPNHYPEHYPSLKRCAQESNFTLFYGDLRQSEKLSEIKPPLTR